MSIKKQVVSGVKWTTISTCVLAATALLKISVLTRYLDKIDFGLIALVTFVLSIMELFNTMGLNTAILHKKDISKEEYASIYWVNILLSILIYSILYLITPFISIFYSQPQLNILIPLLGLNLFSSGIGLQFRVIEQKNLLFKQISLVDVITSIISLIAAVYLAIEGYGVFSIIYSSILQNLLSNITFLVIGLKKHGLLFHFNFNETKPFLKIGIYQVGGQIINLFNKNLDILLIGKFFSAEILGGYSLAQELVRRPVALINPILNKVGAPALASFNDNKVKLKDYYLKLVNLVATLTIPLYLCIIVFASIIVRILYGPNFENIVILVQILAVNMIFRNIGGVVGNLVIATGRTDLDFKWNLIAILITPLLVLIGAQYSITGVAFMVTFGAILLYVPSWYFYIKKLLNISLLEYTKAFFVIRKIKL